MKKIKKILRVFTLLCLSFSITLLLLTSCNEVKEKNTEEDSNNNTERQTSNDDTSTENKSYKADYLPDINYNGYEFRIVVAENDAYDLTTAANVEEESGDTVKDAIYKRNRLIEEKYDIKIKQISVADYWELPGKFKKSVTSGSDDFDLGMMISREAWATALTGAIAPVNRLPYVDISQPWYAHDVNSEISINGNLYFAYSDECLNMFEATSCVMFNKKLTDELALENMYSLVKENKWTIDKFFTLAKTAVSDLDGNGEMTDTDRYGILSQFDMFYPCFWVSSGIKTVGKDENDMLVFTGQTGQNEKLFNVLNKVYQNIFGGEKIFFDAFKDKITSYQYQSGEDQRRVSRMQFENNNGLFFIQFIGVIPALRAMETDFGILPLPKYDETQEKYYSRVVDGWINCVPVTAPDLERTSIIMEALAVESKNITIPAYFETALRTKYARDDESQEMLDIIHTNRTMDLGDTFYMDDVRNTYVDILNAKKDTFASAVEKNANKIDKALQKANEAALAIE